MRVKGTYLILSWAAMVLVVLLFVQPANAQMGPGGGGGMGGGGGGGGMGGMTSKEMLGMHLFRDANLSEPPGQSCMDCHSPMAGFADPVTTWPTSQGANPSLFGNRNSPTAAYMSFSPTLLPDATLGTYVGGLFWDGRANSLSEQAKGPFLNPLEMANPSAAGVVAKVKGSMYASLFLQVYGTGAFIDAQQAFDNIADAIAAFESSSHVNRFSSKYDLYLAGQTTLTSQEARGLSVVNSKCGGCHPSRDGSKAGLFTNFAYYNAGVPRNPNNPFYTSTFNPDGAAWVDLGLGKILGKAEQNGKMKTPTLRNVAVTPPYGHNGVFGTLKAAVSFMNKRTGTPEVSANLSTQVGNLGLTNRQVDNVVAFLRTLTDSGGGGMGR